MQLYQKQHTSMGVFHVFWIVQMLPNRGEVNINGHKPFSKSVTETLQRRYLPFDTENIKLDAQLSLRLLWIGLLNEMKKGILEIFLHKTNHTTHKWQTEVALNLYHTKVNFPTSSLFLENQLELPNRNSIFNVGNKDETPLQKLLKDYSFHLWNNS